ncbi:dUTPase-like protein [Lasiosphaeria hispida]|uniref:dUTPase-like protein n=1 Tax=Lasiosphaeria hispida TaxID=260671 RepID=A0AAJ0HFA7_9PEZI|nr:dUTPase-like protein [Lasiosphaeria hispida]
MLLSGASIVERGIIRNLLQAARQVQPCGVDLSLRRVLRFSPSSMPKLDFDNARRERPGTVEIPFAGAESVVLEPGAYVVEFNEMVEMPRDCMGQIFARSSLWRSGAFLTAGVVDAGYGGVLGALLDVRHSAGLELFRNAKLGQIVLHQMEGEVEGYNGVYQGLGNMDGPTADAVSPER